MSSKAETLKALVVEFDTNYEKFSDKGNKTAGTRARKSLQEIKKIAQEIRMDISNAKKEE